MKYRHVLLVALLFLLFHSAGAQAEAETWLQSINHSVLSPGSEQVILQFNGPSKLKQFTLQGERPRVVFDFSEVLQARTVNNVIPVNSALLKQIRTGIHRGDTPKTRVVLDIDATGSFKHTHRLDEVNHRLIITISDGKKPVESKKKPLQDTSPQAESFMPSVEILPPKPIEEKMTPGDLLQGTPHRASLKLPPPPPSPLLKAVEYKPDAGKGEMVLFHLNGFYPPIVYGVEEGVPRAVCDFKKARLGEGVKSIKNINARYIRSVRIGKHLNPDKVRVVIDLKPNNIYDLQQVFFRKNNLFMIIINTVKDKPAG